jgi:hypothetical protein
MSDLLSRITAHRAETARLREIEGPEWGTTIYCRAPNIIEAAEIDRVRREEGEAAAAVRALVLLARDADGQPLLSRAAEAQLLREADASVIFRVVGLMLDDAGINSVDGAKKS